MNIKYYIDIVLKIIAFCFFLYSFYEAIKDLYLRKQLSAGVQNNLSDKMPTRSITKNVCILLFSAFFIVYAIVMLVDFFVKNNYCLL